MMPTEGEITVTGMPSSIPGAPWQPAIVVLDENSFGFTLLCITKETSDIAISRKSKAGIGLMPNSRVTSTKYWFSSNILDLLNF